MTKNNVLVINGKRYDATTGQPLDPSDQPAHKARSIDGLSQPKKSTTQAVKKQTAKEKVPEPARAVAQSSAKRGHAHDIILSRTIHSSSTAKPLMRRGVTKPSKTSNQHKPAESLVKAYKTHEIATHHNPAREQRAEKIHRSTEVKHFSKHHSSESRSGGTTGTPPASSQTKMMESVTGQMNKLQNIIDRGMQKATSHDQESPVKEKRKHRTKRSKFRTFNILIVVIAVLLIVGFIIDKNMPNIDIHIASSRSGVHAEIPSYIPAGYKFQGPIKYGQGIVTVIFTSGNNSFRVIQQNSTWDSTSLRDSFLTTANQHYTVVEAGGRIVYLYGEADATWVNGGIWYQITDNANFSTATLLRIVTSL
jgi:hypothetical protein